MAIVGYAVNNYYFVFHLTLIAVRSTVLLYVLRALWEPKKAIFFTLVLFFIIEFGFSLYAYSQFNSDYPENHCNTLARCFFITIDQTFKNDGGVGGFLNPAYDKS